MKKFITFTAALILTASLFAISYKNNTYQKLADEYTRKAEYAMDAGQYDDAIEYSKKAEENAELSQAYVKWMMERKEASDRITLAKNKFEWAVSVDAENTFPMAFTSAKTSIENADKSFEDEEFQKAAEYANEALTTMDGIYEVTPLPEYYIVRPWAETKDCYWNISGRPYVYNNPLLWENLYHANKTKMPKPEDPNLIRPGMKMQIPSITGEYRSGTYDPKKEYEAYTK